MLEKIKSIVADQLGVDEDQVTEDASFIDDLEADSLDTVKYYEIGRASCRERV